MYAVAHLCLCSHKQWKAQGVRKGGQRAWGCPWLRDRYLANEPAGRAGWFSGGLWCAQTGAFSLPLFYERWVNQTTLVHCPFPVRCERLSCPSFLLLFQGKCKERLHWVYNAFLNLGGVEGTCDKHHCSCDNAVFILAAPWRGSLDLYTTRTCLNSVAVWSLITSNCLLHVLQIHEMVWCSVCCSPVVKLLTAVYCMRHVCCGAAQWVGGFLRGVKEPCPSTETAAGMARGLW